MKQNLLFDTFRQWWMCFRYSLELILKGVCKLAYALLFGLLSVISWLWKLLVDAVKKYPKSTIFISVLALYLVWLFMFTHYRTLLSNTEYARDSVSYRLQAYDRMYDGTTDSLIIVRKDKNDTITFK